MQLFYFLYTPSTISLFVGVKFEIVGWLDGGISSVI